MWPTPQDYNESVQNPQLCFGDAELRECIAETTPLGLPKPISGSFASVYHMRGPRGQYAVRCFLRDVPDQAWRYEQITQFLRGQAIPYMVPFEFLPQGIKVGANWFPILKMQWSTGQSLIEWIEANLHNPNNLQGLMAAFGRMCMKLQKCGIAHGDLQHGNILIANNELRLVDYDGMFVPTLAGMQSNELGHRHYQHPRRSSRDFDLYLDNFSAWSIYTSLYCLTKDNRLWHDLGAGDECLLFRQDDYLNPNDSIAFRHLEHHDSATVRDAAKTLRCMLSERVEQLPSLGEPMTARPEVPDLLPFIAPAMSSASAVRIKQGDRINLRLAAQPEIILKEPPPRLRVVDEPSPKGASAYNNQAVVQKIPVPFKQPRSSRSGPPAKPPYTVPPSKKKKTFWNSGYAAPIFIMGIFVTMAVASSFSYMHRAKPGSLIPNVLDLTRDAPMEAVRLYTDGRGLYNQAAKESNQALSKQQYEKSARKFESAIGLLNGYERGQAEFQLARCEANLGQYAKALGHFQDAKDLFNLEGKFIPDLEWYIGEMELRLSQYADSFEQFYYMKNNCQQNSTPEAYTESALDGMRRASRGLLQTQQNDGFGDYLTWLKQFNEFIGPGYEEDKKILDTTYSDLKRAADIAEKRKNADFALATWRTLSNIFESEHTQQTDRRLTEIAKATARLEKLAAKNFNVDISADQKSLTQEMRQHVNGSEQVDAINMPEEPPSSDPAVMKANPRLYRR